MIKKCLLRHFFLFSLVMYRPAFAYQNTTRFWTFILFLIPLLSLWGQDVSEQTKPLFREDQFYVGVSFMLLQTNQDQFDPLGLSRHFQWGFVRDIPLNDSGKLASAVGLGMSFERYNTNLERSLDEFNKASYSFNSAISSPLFFSVHSFELPLSIRWRNATPESFAFWRVYGGVSLRWNYYNKLMQDKEQIRNIEDLNPFGTVAHLSFGYNTWNFYIAYHLSPFFNTDSISTGSIPFELNPIKIGLIFYIL